MSINGAKLLALGAALLFSGSMAAAADKLSSGDQRFIKDAAGGGMMEVELGKRAAEKASSPQVKEFGRKMEQDHSKANAELQKLASTKNVQIPHELEGKQKSTCDRRKAWRGDQKSTSDRRKASRGDQKSTYDRLAKLSGDRFDRE